MHVFGFSINALTLFGLVLAIGIVVDDAIVVVENVERNIENGLPAREATIQAMREVSGPIIAIALVLVAVFVPLALITGLTGQFYKQFALTIAISDGHLSGQLADIIACARRCSPQRPRRAKDRLTRAMDFAFGWFFRRFNSAFSWGSNAYSGGVRRLLGHKAVAFLIYLVLIGVAGGLFKVVPVALCQGRTSSTLSASRSFRTAQPSIVPRTSSAG